MTTALRLPRLLALVAALMLVVAACGGSASPSPTDAASVEPTAAPTASPTEEPTDSADPGDETDLTGAAEALAGLTSYQIDINVAGVVPTASGASGVTMSAIVDRENDAVDFTMSGFEGLTTGEEGLRVILIGNDAWLDLGTGTFIAQPGGAGSFEGMVDSLAPASLLTSVPEDALSGPLVVGQEDKNGVATTHYRLDSSVPGFADSLGPDGEADIWIAVDGGYLVSMSMSGVTEVDGEQVELVLSFDVSRINDPTIDIQPPD
ncbi:MAG TPA: hypothetical protein VFR14_00455 [Candidatus Limnocylindrales bacterium]|nr:hypothetical protein [Candidatus Limnocylindrales bacterium]